MWLRSAKDNFIWGDLLLFFIIYHVCIRSLICSTSRTAVVTYVTFQLNRVLGSTTNNNSLNPKPNITEAIPLPTALNRLKQTVNLDAYSQTWRAGQESIGQNPLRRKWPCHIVQRFTSHMSLCTYLNCLKNSIPF